MSTSSEKVVLREWESLLTGLKPIRRGKGRKSKKAAGAGGEG